MGFTLILTLPTTTTTHSLSSAAAASLLGYGGEVVGGKVVPNNDVSLLVPRHQNTYFSARCQKHIKVNLSELTLGGKKEKNYK